MRLSQGSGEIRYARAPGTVSGSSGTYGFVTATTPAFLFDGAIPSSIANSWTRTYNIHSTQGVGASESMEKTPEALLFGSWSGQTTQYSFNNAPVRAFGDLLTKTTGYKIPASGWF